LVVSLKCFETRLTERISVKLKLRKICSNISGTERAR
jgi:hypothetical protein